MGPKRVLSMLALALAAVVGLGGLSQTARAGTTTLTFDEFTNGTVLANQYPGVTISGATVYTSCATCAYPSLSGTNVAYAPSGLMTFSFSSTNVQTVSAYLTDYNGAAGIYAYDASNNLLGQAVATAGSVNTLLSVTTSGSPIASVTIHNAGSQFAVDNVSFITPQAAGSLVWTSFALAFGSSSTISTFTPDQNITVTRIQAQLPLAPTHCKTNATLVVTDGTTPTPALTLSALANDSGPISVSFSAGGALSLKASQPAQCSAGVPPLAGNIVVQYRVGP